MHEYSDPSSQISQKNSHSSEDAIIVYLGNLNYSATQSLLESALEPYNASKVHIAKKDGKPAGYAFITFESDIDAYKAINDLNNSTYMG